MRSMLMTTFHQAVLLKNDNSLWSFRWWSTGHIVPETVLPTKFQSTSRRLANFCQKTVIYHHYPSSIAFSCCMNWEKIAKWPKLAIFIIFSPSKIADLPIYRHSWQHCPENKRKSKAVLFGLEQNCSIFSNVASSAVKTCQTAVKCAHHRWFHCCLTTMQLWTSRDWLSLYLF